MVLSRLGREHDIKEKADEIPLVVYLFDLLYHEGHDLMDTSQMDRRDLLRSSFRSTKRVMITASLVSNDRDEVGAFLDQAVADGHEGLMAKNPSAPYQPGRRNYSWMKLKPEPESLDVVVVGAVWGSGARKGLLSSLVIAVREGDDLFEIGKVGTGFSIEMLESLTEKLEPRITDSRGRHVDLEPSAIIEVDFKSIQQTDTYDSGFALRIPRFKRERTDKGLRDADTLSRVKKLFKDQ
jgi:DNA ligase-1